MSTKLNTYTTIAGTATSYGQILRKDLLGDATEYLIPNIKVHVVSTMVSRSASKLRPSTHQHGLYTRSGGSCQAAKSGVMNIREVCALLLSHRFY
jgi:hypothetical protein